MALSKVFEYETVTNTVIIKGEPVEIQETVKKYDYRRELRAKQERPENIRKRNYLTNGTVISGVKDNTTPLQQFVSITPNNEVAGYFEYNISKVVSEETEPVYTYEYNTETGEIIQVQAVDADGNPIYTPVFMDDYTATISEMMSFDDAYFMTFGADLYNILEHCFLDPIPTVVYEFLNQNKKTENDFGLEELIPTITNDGDENITTIEEQEEELHYISSVEWFVFPHNPAEELYDVLVTKMGGHIILPQNKGNLKKYVLTREEFLAKAYRGNPDDLNN